MGFGHRTLTAAVALATACLFDAALAATAEAPAGYDAGGATLVASAAYQDPLPRIPVLRHPDRLRRASAGRVPRIQVSPTAAGDIPVVALRAYQRAAAVMAGTDPACKLPWSLLAAIGRVESDHGRFGGSRLGVDGVDRPAVLGPVLDGRGQVAAIRDTDNGALDHNRTWDRAVGPMQIIPSTWRLVAVDGDGDGVRNPQDIYDATLAAGVYLCYSADHLDTAAGLQQAVWHYNPSSRYVATVLALQRAYAGGGYALPALAGQPGAGVLTTPGHRVVNNPPTRARAGAGRLTAGAEVGRRTGIRAVPAPSRPQVTTRQEQLPAAPGSTPSQSPAPAGQQPTGQPGGGPVGQPTDQPTGPAPTATGTPGDSSGQTPTPTPTGTPTGATPAPALTTLSGTWTTCPDATPQAPEYCLGDTRLDLGTADQQAAPAAADYDGDGNVGTIAEELAGLVGQEVTVDVVTGTATVQRINELAYRAADGTLVTGTTGPNGS